MSGTSLRPSPTALLNPCADPIFKIMFTDESSEAHEALTCFLTDIIGKKVTDVVLQPNELSGESISDKQSEFDINCKIQGKIVNIEMQGRNEKDGYGKRTEYHVAHLLNHYTPKGMEWMDIPQVYQISVLNFVFDKETEGVLNHYMLRNSAGCTVSETLNVIFLELPKVVDLPDDVNLLTVPQMWGKFFLYGSVPEKQDFIELLAAKNRGIEMAVTVLKNVSQDELNWYHESRYWMQVSDEKTRNRAATERGLAEGRERGLAEGRERGLAEGRERGRAEGIFETKKENALNLLKMNVLSVEQISQAVGLSLDEVQKLAAIQKTSN